MLYPWHLIMDTRVMPAHDAECLRTKFEAALTHRHVPDLARVVSYRAVRGEPAHARRVQNRRAPPAGGRTPQRIDLALGLPVSVKIGGDHEAVIIAQRVHDRHKADGIVARERYVREADAHRGAATRDRAG